MQIHFEIEFRCCLHSGDSILANQPNRIERSLDRGRHKSYPEMKRHNESLLGKVHSWVNLRKIEGEFFSQAHSRFNYRLQSKVLFGSIHGILIQVRLHFIQVLILVHLEAIVRAQVYFQTNLYGKQVAAILEIIPFHHQSGFHFFYYAIT